MESLSVVIVGGDSSMQYLLKRYAEQMGLNICTVKKLQEAEPIQKSESVAVIFSSVESLEEEKILVAQFTNLDIPIIVCSSAFEQMKAIELGADYFLLHPLVFDNFSSTLNTAIRTQTNQNPKDEAKD